MKPDKYPASGLTSARSNQHPAWTRTLDIVLRAAHVLVISILFGGAVFKIPAARLLPFQVLSIVTGAALIASEVAHRRRWPSQGRGLMVYIHVGLFSLASFRPSLAVPCLLAALVIGMTGSHMPKNLRYWDFIHRHAKG
jgi:hypothetical protein